MFGAWFNSGLLGSQFHLSSSIGINALSILLTGIAIKLMDDWLDLEFDECTGKGTVARKLGKATLPYAMFALIIGSLFNPPLAAGLFLASYSVGMAFQFRDRMPSGLPGYIEAVFAVILGIVLAGIPIMAFSLLMMGCVQILDDILDRQKDHVSGQSNLAGKLGIVESTLLFLLLFVACILLNAMYTSLVMVVLPIITFTMEWRR